MAGQHHLGDVRAQDQNAAELVTLLGDPEVGACGGLGAVGPPRELPFLRELEHGVGRGAEFLRGDGSE